jgi:threonine dehydratase
MKSLNIPSHESILSASKRLNGTILRSPLIRFETRRNYFSRQHVNEGATTINPEIYLKLENLQSTGSFKVRGAGNALLSTDPSVLQNGVWTASAGNMGQALAWYAQKLNLPCTVLVPNDAPDLKIQAIQSLGAEIVKVPFAEYQSIQKEGAYAAIKGVLIHPFADETVMAGNGTIGLEILEDLPDVDTILVPYGGGGLSCGIAAAVRSSAHLHHVSVEAVEVATAAPLTRSLSAGRMVEVPYQASFVSGMGAPFVFPQMWDLANHLLADSRLVELPQVAEAIRLMAERHHIIVEGAGAVALAAALTMNEKKKVVCVVSGGNINAAHLNKILLGEIP